jgi:outer membrane immunogenic protein
MMRMVLISGVATALLSGAAFAADLPSKKEAPAFVPPPPPVTWTGFYIGVNAGYGGDEFRYPFFASYAERRDEEYRVVGGVNGSASLTSSGFLGGGQVGYNYQFATSWVGGLEADIDATSITGKAKVDAAGYYGDVSGNAGVQVKSELPYLGTVRARLGYLVTDRFLVFGTGGLAYGDVKTSASVGANVPYFDFSGAYGVSKTTTQVGWTLGAGVEYKINDNWSFKTEYLYVDLGSANLLNGSARIEDDGVLSYGLKEKATDNIVRAGLNYKIY